ncbi:MAG: hypothetical protein Q9227_002608 [Pyrenula ochraceoflavens]
MAACPVNILLSTFHGLSLPSTLPITLRADNTISELLEEVDSLLPPSLQSRLLLSTTDNVSLLPSPCSISSLTSDHDILPLRLYAPLCGGKGGFGSQLRAAGGRMSSRKKRAQGEQNGSSRNLDGRRLRTITEAKNLAEYLALKPEMDAREKEERRKRWESIVEAAEQRQEEIREGRRGKGKGLSSEWIEDKEELGERARDAVVKAMQSGKWTDRIGGGEEGEGSQSASASGGSGSPSDEDSDKEIKDAPDGPSASAPKPKAAPQRKFFGFDDEDDEFMSDDAEEDLAQPETEIPNGDKGKGKAVEV